MSKIHVFKSIFIGGLSKEQLIENLVSSGVRFNKFAEELFNSPEFIPSSEIKRVSLVKLKQADLGLDKATHIIEIDKCAFSLGLSFCPLYLAAFLRLEYMDQQEGPYLTVASKKIEQSEDIPRGFYLRKMDNLFWLRGYRASDDYVWPLDHEFIFMAK